MTIYEAKIKAVVRQMLTDGNSIAHILHNVETWTEETITE